MKEYLKNFVGKLVEVGGFQGIAILLVYVLHIHFGIELLPSIFGGVTLAILISGLKVVGKYIGGMIDATLPKIVEHHSPKLVSWVQSWSVKKFLIVVGTFILVSISSIAIILYYLF